ncbi:LOW QUALITY PROTEIN: hypothetical protein ACHAWF_004633 [Thalassiosira exigua]
MFDDGYVRLSAFDYAPEGVECARRMFAFRSDRRLVRRRRPILPYDDATFYAVLDKGTLDSVLYLSGGKDQELAREHLGIALSELARVVKVGGITFSVTAACAEAFDECNEGARRCKQLRDGSSWATEDGYASNNVGATIHARSGESEVVRDDCPRLRSGRSLRRHQAIWATAKG